MNVIYVYIEVDENELKKLKERTLIVPLVSDNEARVIAQEIRIIIILTKTSLESLRDKYEDKVSIIELARSIKKKVKLSSDEIIKLCRYVIEPRTNNEITFSEFTESDTLSSIKKLFELIGNCSLNDGILNTVKDVYHV